METHLIYKICFGLGGILLLIAISYSYDILTHPKSKRIKNLFWILGNVFLVLSLFFKYQTGKDIDTTLFMILMINLPVLYKIMKDKKNINPDN
jgi:hypothetical protein